MKPTFYRVHHRIGLNRYTTRTFWNQQEALDEYSRLTKAGVRWVLLNRHKEGVAVVSLLATPAVMKGD